MRSLIFALVALSIVQASAEPLSCVGLFVGEQPSVLELKDKTKIAYREVGSQESDTVIVMLNGLGKDMNQWNEVRDHLLDAREKSLGALLVQVDLFGEGWTGELNNDSNDFVIHFQEQVGLLHQLIKAKWPGKKLVIAGHSYGGGIAARYAREFPSEVEQLILLAPFVDNLETHQPIVGPIYAWARATSELFGFKALYDTAVMTQSSFAMSSLWLAYGLVEPTHSTLPEVMALTRGNRDLQMTESVQHTGSTRVNLILSAGDAIVPYLAHASLWNAIPQANRGREILIPSLHDSVSLMPMTVAHNMRQILKHE